MDINKIIDIVRTLKEEGGPTMAMGNGQIAGSVESGDDPPVPVKKKKRQPTPVGRYGTRRTWMQNG